MRALGLAALAVAITGFTTVADAQSSRRRGENPPPPKGETPPPKEDKRFPLGKQWIAVSLNKKAYSGMERPSFQLNEQFRATGFGGCNTFSATAFPLREQGIAVGPLALTKKSCDKGLMAQEHAFFVALRTAQKWDIPGGSLILKGPNGELRFERSL